MSKYRIYELAKELKTDNKTILSILEKHNITGKKALSSVDDSERKIITQSLTKQKPTEKKAQPIKRTQPVGKVQSQKKAVTKNNAQVNRPEKPSGTTVNKVRAVQNHGNEKRISKGNEYIKTVAQRQNNAHRSNDMRTNTTGNRNHQQPNHQANHHQNGQQLNHQPNHQQQNHQQTSHTGRVNRNQQAGTQQRPQQHTPHRNNNNQNAGAVKTVSAAGNDNRHIYHGNKPANNHGNNANNRNNQNRHAQGRNNRRNWRRNNRNHPVQQKQEIVRPKLIKVGETISVKELASKMTYSAADVIKKLIMLGTMATINQEIDFDTATLVANEFKINVEELPPEADLTEIPEIEDAPEDLQARPPVVTVMGHVDHGKTSLLDVIRKTSVSSNEAGGITQHIGAYQVMCKGKKIVFLDTPGHEAFTAMRARGAQVTDIAVLVVAADDGVMPQTLEAINHARAAKVPIVVAINKIDKPGANPEHVKQQLSEQELVAEDWGGDTIMVPVSAKKHLGINDLLEMILLVAEMQELKANPNRDARGIIIEAQLDKGRGPVATVLIQNGTLHVGDSIIAGTAYGKVRAMINDRGEKVRKAGPAMPVEVLGLSDLPEAGDELATLEEHMVRTIAEKRIGKKRTELIHTKKVSLDDLFEQINEGNIKDLNILLKADVQGSVEALKTSLMALNKSDEVRVSIIHAGVGAVNESDVMLASAANALILAFNVRPDANARKLADTEKIDIRTYRVIYEAINDIKAAMKGMLAPKFKEVIQGKVEIRQVMKFSKALVAGSYVVEGKITNNSKIRILRDNVVMHEGELDSLRRFKDDVKEVAAGFECGITIANYRDFKEGDIIEAYTMEEIAPQSL